MARAKTTGQDPAARLLMPVELAQVLGEGPVRVAYRELWMAHAQLGVENGQLRQRVQELERREGLHNRNCGRPRTTDGVAKPSAPKPPSRSGRAASGGRPGAAQAASPASRARPCRRRGTRTRSPPTCPRSAPHRRQVFDLPAPPPLEVTEH